MGKLICPFCGDATSVAPLSFPASVSRQVRATIGGAAVREESGIAQAIAIPHGGQPLYGIMLCQSCAQVFVAKLEEGQWMAVYPIRHEPVSKDIPEPMRSEFEEALLCFAVDAYSACVSTSETTLEALWRNKKVSGLNELKEKGSISPTLFDQATEVRLWANMAKHELAHKVVAKEDAEQLLGYLEAILDAVYVQPARFAALKQKREQKLGKAPSQE